MKKIVLSLLFVTIVLILSAQTKTFTVGGVSFDMVAVKGGSFYMGASNVEGELNYHEDAYDSEGPVHKVTLSDYYIGKYVVTQKLWYAVMKQKPHSDGTQLWSDWPDFVGDDFPAFYVSRDDLQKFIYSLNESMYSSKQLTSRSYYFAIPTEAQWEFAAKGGNLSQNTVFAGSNDYDKVAWTSENADDNLHKVGLKAPNELGLYDMCGNVAEWCRDYYAAYSAEDQVDPYNDYGAGSFVLRGGLYPRPASLNRIAHRSYADRDRRASYIGARLVLIAPIEEAPSVDVNENNANQISLAFDNNLKQITLYNVEIGSSIVVYNLLGVLVHTQKVSNSTEPIDISHLQSGVYIVKVADLTQKIAINN